MSKFIDRTGERHLNYQGCWMTIIAYRNARDCDIQFDDGTIIINRMYYDIKKGTTKNTSALTVFGVGYFGIGEYKSSVNDKITKVYSSWQGMLERCYCEKSLFKNPTYKGCSVDKKWHNFQVFAAWFENNYNSEYEGRWDIDKDILKKGNKIYSPETCTLVPKEINGLFVKSKKRRGLYPVGVRKNGNGFAAVVNKHGENFYLGTFPTPEEAFEVYKKAKEEWIKIMADKWRGQITEPCYEAMYRYEVEITD